MFQRIQRRLRDRGDHRGLWEVFLGPCQSNHQAPNRISAFQDIMISRRDDWFWRYCVLIVIGDHIHFYTIGSLRLLLLLFRGPTWFHKWNFIFLKFFLASDFCDLWEMNNIYRSFKFKRLLGDIDYRAACRIFWKGAHG